MAVCPICGEGCGGCPDPRDAEIARLNLRVAEQTARAERAEAERDAAVVRRDEACLESQHQETRASGALAACAELRAKQERVMEGLTAARAMGRVQGQVEAEDERSSILTRAQAAEAACAELRAALVAITEDTPCDHLDHHGVCQTHSMSSAPCAVGEAQALLSRPDLGRGWASPEMVAKARDAAIKCGDCVLCQGTAERHDDGCPIADLDALLKKGGG